MGLINWSVDWFMYQLQYRLINWFINWSIVLFVDQLIDKFIKWLITGLIHWSIDWSIDAFIDQLTDKLFSWLTNWSTNWSVEQLIVRQELKGHKSLLTLVIQRKSCETGCSLALATQKWVKTRVFFRTRAEPTWFKIAYFCCVIGTSDQTSVVKNARFVGIGGAKNTWKYMLFTRTRVKVQMVLECTQIAYFCGAFGTSDQTHVVKARVLLPLVAQK